MKHSGSQWAELAQRIAASPPSARGRGATVVRWWLALVAVGALIGACTLVWARAARAEPDDPWSGSPQQARDAILVCRNLDRNPTEDGVVGTVQTMIAEGVLPVTAGHTLALAVTDDCPQYLMVARAAMRDILASAPQSIA